MKNLYTGSETTKQIKKELKSAFPGIKFSVKYSSFSGGDSAHISWEFGPSPLEVEAIANKYQYGRFNGMEDIYEFDSKHVVTEGGELAQLGGVKYVSCTRTIPSWFVELVSKELCILNKVEYNGEWTDIQGDYVLAIAGRLIRKNSFKTNSPAFVGLKDNEKLTGLSLDEFYDLQFTEAN